MPITDPCMEYLPRFIDYFFSGQSSHQQYHPQKISKSFHFCPRFFLRKSNIYQTRCQKNTRQLMGYLCMVYFAHVNFVDFYRQSVGEQTYHSFMFDEPLAQVVWHRKMAPIFNMRCWIYQMVWWTAGKGGGRLCLRKNCWCCLLETANKFIVQFGNSTVPLYSSCFFNVDDMVSGSGVQVTIWNQNPSSKQFGLKYLPVLKPGNLNDDV